MKRTMMAGVVVSAGLFVLTACGGGDAGSSSAHDSHDPSATASVVAAHNDADVEFATDMIPHHQQAIAMAKLAATRASNAQVKTLAAAVQAAQDPEIQQMSAWLTAWGRPVPTPGAHDGHDMSGSMPGMMSAEEMAELEKSSGTAFDRMWLQMMVRHHQGAVEMARAEQKNGKDPQAVALAKKVEADQTREIATMRQLLTKLPS